MFFLRYRRLWGSRHGSSWKRYHRHHDRWHHQSWNRSHLDHSGSNCSNPPPKKALICSEDIAESQHHSRKWGREASSSWKPWLWLHLPREGCTRIHADDWMMIYCENMRQSDERGPSMLKHTHTQRQGEYCNLDRNRVNQEGSVSRGGCCSWYFYDLHTLSTMYILCP